MDSNAFEQDLLRYIGQLCKPGAHVGPDTALFEDRLIDSRRVVDLMEFVERALCITIPDEKLSMEHFRTVGDIVREFVREPARPAAQAAPAAEPPLLEFGGDGLRMPSREGVAQLAERGDIMAGDNGCVAFKGRALALHGFFTRLFTTEAARASAAPRRYPTVLPLADMQKTDYFKSFPQHASFCTCLEHDTATLQAFVADVKGGHPVWAAADGRLEPPGMVLSSALCYHCYREFAGRTLEPGLTVLTTQGQCFRNERGAFRTLDRCYEFTMREIVMLGEAQAIDERRMRLLHRAVAIAEWLGMSGRVEGATDFFFRGDVDGRARALHQRANALKYELRVRMDGDGGSLAVASFNLHEDYFGRSFGIRLADGRAASTGCVGFGIERWVSAFLACHGADPARWPQAVLADIAQGAESLNLAPGPCPLPAPVELMQ